VKGETVKTLHDIAVTNIREGGIKADFSFAMPAGITYPFDLYGVYGATLAANGKTVTFPAVPAVAKSLDNAAPMCVMRFEAKNLAEGAPVSVSFSHLGSLIGVWLTNASASAYTLTSLSLAGNAGYKWLYNASGQAACDITDLTFGDTGEGTELSYPLGGSVGIGTGETVKLYRWMVPTAAPDVSKNITATLNAAVMPETLPAKAFAAGNYYRLKLTWTGTKWIKPTIDNLTIPGSLMHAANGSDFVGVVYSKGDGKVYYNAARTNDTWAGEVDLGTGSEARIAIDGGYPHVVFTTSDKKIAYRKYNGTAWTETAYIETNNAGQCSKPDIAVANGYAHITYTDTEGQNGSYSERPDIMYAANGSGSFVKTVICNGFYVSYGGGDYLGNYFNKGSYIAVDGSQNYYIITHLHEYEKWSGGNSRSYQTKIFTGKNSATGASGFSSSDTYDIYDVAFNGTDIVALYKDKGVNRSAVIAVVGSAASFTSPQDITTPCTPHGISAGSSGTLVVGMNGTNLITRYNGVEKNHAGITVRSGTRIAAVHVGSVAFAAYTDDTDGKIKFMRP
uniref:hypothetical protein n=1 Tax=Prevotella heparinolytica TaxID=28113 RepID=UPI00359F9B6E